MAPINSRSDAPNQRLYISKYYLVLVKRDRVAGGTVTHQNENNPLRRVEIDNKLRVSDLPLSFETSLLV
jgi:hypothetical protein